MKNDYTICTVCTENYRDCLDFVIHSWNKTSASNIVVYTDTKKWKSKDIKISIVPLFKPSKDWLLNIGRKAVAAKHCVRKFPGQNFVFLDADIYLLHDPVEVFKLDFDLAGSTHPGKKRRINSGVIFFRRNIQLLNAWIQKQKEYKKIGRGMKYYKSAYDQISLGDLITEWEKSGKYKYFDLPYRKWHTRIGEEDTPKTLKMKKKAIKNNKVYIAHLYHKSFKKTKYRTLLDDFVNRESKNSPIL